MKTLNLILRIAYMSMAIVLVLHYCLVVDKPSSTEELIMAFGLAIMSRVEKLNDNFNNNSHE